MLTHICLENWGGSNFGFGGLARKITPLIYPLIFKNFFGHETGRRKSFLSFSTTDRRILFTLMSILKSKVTSLATFGLFLLTFFGQNFGQHFCCFLGVR